jgi:hypothetical protein
LCVSGCCSQTVSQACENRSGVTLVRKAESRVSAGKKARSGCRSASESDVVGERSNTAQSGIVDGEDDENDSGKTALFG